MHCVGRGVVLDEPRVPVVQDGARSRLRVGGASLAQMAALGREERQEACGVVKRRQLVPEAHTVHTPQ